MSSDPVHDVAPVVEAVAEAVQEVAPVVEAVAEAIQDVVPAVEAVAEAVQDVVAEIAQVVEEEPVMREAAVIAEIAIELGATAPMEEEKKTTEEQELIIRLVLPSAKEAAEYILQDELLAKPVKVTKLIAALMTTLEKTRVNGSKISGEHKKAVVLHLAERLMKEYVLDSAALASLLAMAHSMAEHLLETLVETSKGMMFIAEITAQEEELVEDVACCIGFLAALCKIDSSKKKKGNKNARL